jgi:hypothetical protein
MPPTSTTETPSGNSAHAAVPPRRRLLWLGAIGLLLVAAVLGYRYFWLGRPLGQGPAGPTVASEAFGRVWSDRKVVLLGFGDSVTAGYGATTGHSFFLEDPHDRGYDAIRRLLLIEMSRVVPQRLAARVSSSN